MSDLLGPLMRLPGYLTSGTSAIHPGFERIEAMLAGLGRPDRSFKTILVGGTNGKGSTASMIAAMLTASGIRTGLHTSPHLVDVRERMRVDGQLPELSWLEKTVSEHADLLNEVAPSFFEATLAFSLACFAAHDVEWAVVEIGLGGRLDAANVLDPHVSVITSIGMDHMDLLGDTLGAIALEKAGIIRPDRSVVLGRLPEEARKVILGEAARLGSRAIEPLLDVEIHRANNGRMALASSRRRVANVELSLSGSHQIDNAIVALETIDILSLLVSDAAVRRALSDVAGFSGLRARQEVLLLHPLVVVDVAHNPQAMEAAATSFIDALGRSESTVLNRPYLFFACLADKDATGMGTVVQKAFDEARIHIDVVCFSTTGSRGQTAQQTAEKLSMTGLKAVMSTVDLADALEQAGQDGRPCLVAGSHLLAAHALRWKG